MKRPTQDQIDAACKNMGITEEELEKLVNEKAAEIVATKVKKWKAQGKTGISKSTFNRTVNQAVDEILKGLTG